MKYFLPALVVMALVFGAALSATAKPGDNLIFYLDRDAYAAALNRADSGIAILLAQSQLQPAQNALRQAKDFLKSAKDEFASARFDWSLHYLRACVDFLDKAARQHSVASARPIAEGLTRTAQKAASEVVTCVAGFTYEGSPHVTNARRQLTDADAALTRGDLLASANQYRQAVNDVRVVFEGNNLVRPSGDADERQIQETWNGYREGLIRGETVTALSTVTEEAQERFALIFAGIHPDTLATITREMAVIQQAQAFSPTLRWYTVKRYIPTINRTIDFFVYFQQVDGAWKVAGL